MLKNERKNHSTLLLAVALPLATAGEAISTRWQEGGFKFSPREPAGIGDHPFTGTRPANSQRLRGYRQVAESTDWRVIAPRSDELILR